ncbi:Rpn family recombination-promoting nuclease/putative transposase [Curvibacter gracilis]|uniref:Rpn family recombination-promoting nuclease/putative transposase n=1 Tax=Curvibacter gracilis TaxID=230310 RepID=UPI0004B5A2BB|nr:Rpn family recombination-promoting nuclease/putative transposase [Curvibacter gracilis]
MVWRVRARGEWVYLYLLFEFQRGVDKHMALRMMVYIGLLYQDLVKSGQGLPKGRLPPVLPIVLYNGHRRWMARTNIADLIPPLPNPMNGYVPQAKYLLIEENNYVDHPLPSVRNLVAALFRLERPRSPKDIIDLIGLLAEWLKGQPDWARAFSVWISAQLHRSPVLRGLIQATENLLEIKAMLSKHAPWARWAQEYKAEGELLGLEKGIRKGMEQGMEKGLEKGLTEALLIQLKARFAPLPDWVAPQLAQASKSQLEVCLTRLLRAATLDELFDRGGTAH